LEAKKVIVDQSSAHRLLHPRNTVLVSCTDKTGKANIITLAWSMPTSIDPPMAAISIAPRRYSHRLIQETGEFVINIPSMDIAPKVLLCGRISGAKKDKFKEAKLTSHPAQKVKPPIIEECLAHLECRLNQQLTTGDHTLFIGDVLIAYVNEGIFDGKFDIKKFKPIYHIGEDCFASLAAEVIEPKLQ